MPTSTSMPASPAATRRLPPASTSARRSSTGRRRWRFRETRIAGTSVDDRAGCAVIVEVARALLPRRKRPTVHFVFSVQEEFNLRGAVTAAQALQPDIAIQLDLLLATDTPDMGYRGDVRLGGGPAMSLYSFHGRGTLNGTIPHPALVSLFDATAGRLDMHAAAQRPHRRADRFVLCAAGRQRRRLDRSRLSRCAIRIPRWRSAISAISSS